MMMMMVVMIVMFTEHNGMSHLIKKMAKLQQKHDSVPLYFTAVMLNNANYFYWNFSDGSFNSGYPANESFFFGGGGNYFSVTRQNNTSSYNVGPLFYLTTIGCHSPSSRLSHKHRAL
jgi:hypothetical protein